MTVQKGRGKIFLSQCGILWISKPCCMTQSGQTLLFLIVRKTCQAFQWIWSFPRVLFLFSASWPSLASEHHPSRPRDSLSFPLSPVYQFLEENFQLYSNFRMSAQEFKRSCKAHESWETISIIFWTGVHNFFYKGPDSRYSRFWGPNGLYCSYSNLPL